MIAFGEKLFGHMRRLFSGDWSPDIPTWPPASLDPELPSSASSPRSPGYRISLIGTDGDIVSEVPVFVKGSIIEEINQPSVLRFTVAMSEACTTYLVRPYRAEVWDQAGNLVDRYTPWNSEREDDSTGQWLHFRGLSSLSHLARETFDQDYVVPYEAGTTAEEHIRAILAFQDNDPPAIAYGFMDAAIGSRVRGLTIRKGESLLLGIRKLHEAIGGYYWATPAGQFVWRRKRSELTGPDMVYGKNLTGMRSLLNDSDIVTKLYYYGEDLAGREITLKDAGEGEEYLLADEDHRTKYGLLKRFIFDSQVTSAAQILSQAQTYLAEYQDLSPDYAVEVLDLSQDPRYRFDLDLSLRIGDSVAITNAAIQAGQTQRNIVRIERSLDEPKAKCVLGRLTESLLAHITRRGTGVVRIGEQIGHTPLELNSLLDSMRHCPDAVLYQFLGAGLGTIVVHPDYLDRLWSEDDLPATIRLFPDSGSYETNEVVEVDAIGEDPDGRITFTISERALEGTVERAWPALTWLQKLDAGQDTKARPSVCDILRADNLPYDPTDRDKWSALHEGQGLLDKMHRCPEAVLEDLLAVAGGSLLVTVGYESQLPDDADCPWQMDLYAPNDDSQFERVTVSAVVDRTYTLSSRGDDAPELTTLEKADRLLGDTEWPAGTWARDVYRAKPVTCDLATKDDVVDELMAELEKCPEATLGAGLTDSDMTLTVSDRGRRRIGKDAECPFQLKLYLLATPTTYELVTVSSVNETTWVYTLSSRGDGDSTARAWVSGSGISSVTRETPVTCDIITEQTLADAFEEVLAGDEELQESIIEELSEAITDAVIEEIAADDDLLVELHMARMFTGADLAAVEALEESETYPDLVFRDGDFCLTTTGGDVLYCRKDAAWAIHCGTFVANSFANLPDAANVPETALARVSNSEDDDDGKLYKIDAAKTAWEEVGRLPFYEAATYAALPAIDGPAFGYTTHVGEDEDPHYWFKLATWIPLDYFK